MPKLRTVVIAATVAASVTALGAAVVATATSSGAAAACGVVFDDFNYSSPTDARLGQRGWHLRGNAGGPGVPGASWSSNNISFPTVDGAQVAQLRAATNGTPQGTTHAELSLSNRRFFEGTYLSRIKFSDAPISGTDGDIVNQTFYTISPLEGYRDPTYSELDFMEYLPNGGWDGPQAGYQTSWYTYTAEPWYKDGLSGQQNRSYAGWHDIMATVANGQITYYVDGQVVATHGGKYYPRKNMSIDFNQWFIDLTGHQGSGTSDWRQSIDYVYHAKKQVLTPAQANAAVARYRSAGTTHTDTVVAGNDCDAGTPPPNNPPGQPDPPAAGAVSLQSNFSGRCIDIPEANAIAGALLQQWDCNRSEAQKWTFAGDGTLRAMGKCMDPAGGALTNGTLIQLADCNSNPVQRFTLGADRMLRNVSAGRCVDVKDWDGRNRARLQLWDCAGTSNQIWGRI
jgi:hypothetical protein